MLAGAGGLAVGPARIPAGLFSGATLTRWFPSPGGYPASSAGTPMRSGLAKGAADMDKRGLETLLAVALAAALAPMIAAALPKSRVPQVVILILFGILLGPHGLGLADTASIQLLSNIGLGFLFLLAGYELEPRLLRQRPGRLAIYGWAMSAALSLGVVAGLAAAGQVHDFVPIALALTTTALGTLLPILGDNGMLEGSFGRHVLAAGAVGELFPIIAISLFLTKRNEYVAIASLLAVVVAALVLAVLPRLFGDARLRRLVEQGRRATAQTTLRVSIVLLLVLLVAAERFGLDVVLGAMLAGMVLRSWLRKIGADVRPLEDKLDAVGYGLFIPIFFVVSGMTLDVTAIVRDPLRLLAFLILPYPAPDRAGAALAAGLPPRTAAAAAGRNDLHHGDDDAAAHRAG